MHQEQRIGMCLRSEVVRLVLTPFSSQQFAQSGLFISTNEGTFTGSASPATDQATNLFTFLAMRFANSFGPAPGMCFVGCTVFQDQRDTSRA